MGNNQRREGVGGAIGKAHVTEIKGSKTQVGYITQQCYSAVIVRKKAVRHATVEKGRKTKGI